MGQEVTEAREPMRRLSLLPEGRSNWEKAMAEERGGHKPHFTCCGCLN